MANKREKTLSYRRAEWLTDIPKATTLESCLRDAHNKLKTVDERTIIRDNGQCVRSVARELIGGTAGIVGHGCGLAVVVSRLGAGAAEYTVSRAFRQSAPDRPRAATPERQPSSSVAGSAPPSPPSESSNSPSGPGRFRSGRA